jgi:hypothetical protein
MIMLLAAMALGAAGHYFENPTMTGGGFGLAVCAGLVWLVRAAWERRGSSGDTGSQTFDEGGGSHHAATHDTPSGGDGPVIGSDS